ncbi:MAG: DUF1684 domain-containing protein [Acidobacteria bacterium]|nr:DUF1684 domain-containing protein [Acidobacteriota bacterium]MBV9476086.1 DUF1684 domain-containing protein [Acidobacteriota bacterium]
MKAFTAIVVATVFLVSCKKEEQPAAPAAAPPSASAAKTSDPTAEVMEWRANRAKRLQAEDGWLSLVGLDWLKDGPNHFTPDLGTTTLANGKVTLTPVAGMTIDDKPVTAPVALRDDSDANGPTIVRIGTKRFNVIKRGDRYALRVKDSQAETRTHFKGLDYFPVNEKWRVVAHFEPYNPPKKMPIVDITGRNYTSDSPGALVFTVDGKEYRLDPIVEEGESDFFIIFKDETSRDTTYQAARYLYATPPGKDGTVVVDFNKAYNPPCAFTSFATCPLPPPQNRLPVRIEAGEKRYAGGHA